jgi:phage shock protein B
MDDGAIVAVVAIVFGSIVMMFKMIFQPSGRSKADKSVSGAAIEGQKELFDLAMRLQNRVETLERLLDTTQPEWRGKP